MGAGGKLQGEETGFSHRNEKTEKRWVLFGPGKITLRGFATATIQSQKLGGIWWENLIRCV